MHTIYSAVELVTCLNGEELAIVAWSRVHSYVIHPTLSYVILIWYLLHTVHIYDLLCENHPFRHI